MVTELDGETDPTGTLETEPWSLVPSSRNQLIRVE